jgi:hypothetical protein
MLFKMTNFVAEDGGSCGTYDDQKEGVVDAPGVFDVRETKPRNKRSDNDHHIRYHKPHRGQPDRRCK